MSADEWTDAYQVARLDPVTKVQAHYEKRITELESRNALLTEFVVADDEMQEHDRECDHMHPPTCQRIGERVLKARYALTESGFPWETTP